MPYYLDFDSTKNFRDKILARTLDPVYGNYTSPKKFTVSNYIVQNLNDFQNIDQPAVDKTRADDLKKISTTNIFKPNEYTIKDILVDIPRRANLNLYPYFVKSEQNLISILASDNFDTESELFKFAAGYIKKDPNGPILSRIQQNLYAATTAKVRIADALGGNLTTLQAIIRGRQPLVEGNNSVTVRSSILGKGIDFLGTVSGTQLPFSVIPGDYLSNPRNPVNVRPTSVSTATRVWQDLTGVLGSVIGVERRPLPQRKPSDLLIEHTGNASLNRLYDSLSYNKYAPNYTTTARSQQSTQLFNFPNQFAQGIKNALGTEAPRGQAYIGDDRANDVRLATSDIFSGRKIKSSYYLTLMFDKTAAELFHSDKNVINQGRLDGKLTWLSNKTNNRYNPSIADSASTSKNFRDNSILYTTQDILNSKPNGGESFSHIGHIMDQTSRYFKEGDTMISRGNAVMYMKNGQDVGIEYARVWTKDRPYAKYYDTAPYSGDSSTTFKGDIRTPYYNQGTIHRRKNIRKYDGSVLDNTWNLNIAPISNGNKDFSNSTNIAPGYKYGGGFFAKKYMFSIENLAWKNTHLSGFTVNDLPVCERGPNGGRVMWFPPYDLKVNEVSNAQWERNNFLGRPEPIYTYQNTERSGTLSFKIVVDHPSVLNLLVREHFKSMNDEQADAYISSFFAGVKDIDFYSLVSTYANLDKSEISKIQKYLNSNGDQNIIDKSVEGVTTKIKQNQNKNNNNSNQLLNIKLYFPNEFPLGATSAIKSDESYSNINSKLSNLKTDSINFLDAGITSILAIDNEENKKDRFTLANTISTDIDKEKIKTNLNDLIDKSNNNFSSLTNQLLNLKNSITGKTINSDIILVIGSISTSKEKKSDATAEYDYKLSVRRSHSVLKSIIDNLNISTNSSDAILDAKWKASESNRDPLGFEAYNLNLEIPLKDLGYTNSDYDIIIRTINYGEKTRIYGVDCSKQNFYNDDLRLQSPVMYGCRQSDVKISYKTKSTADQEKTEEIKAPSELLINSPQRTAPRPPIEEMKKIVMKVLSEEYYFKKLEEDSPIIFSSLKEKLKYFHPAFHSMTPEGLNARLTFLQQCFRPGDTIPVKNIADNSDIGARNTSFGPPPVCVLRIGDFYHSKVILRDININFDESVWDLNPEGIGVQPMIATVQIQLNFIGGQGIEKPVEKLQNALTSNFYGNTEMYDERSQNTATKIGSQDTSIFSVKFLNELNDKIEKSTNTINPDGKTKYIEGFIGEGSTTQGLSYTKIINEVYDNTSKYFNTYSVMYNDILKKYGSHLTSMMIDKKYRDRYKFLVDTNSTSVELKLFGYINKSEYQNLVTITKDSLLNYLTQTNISDVLDYTNVTSFGLLEYINSEILVVVKKAINSKFDEILSYTFEIENVRDKIINNLDKLNYVVSNSEDVKINGVLSNTAVLSGFTQSQFYAYYSDCINYINDKDEKLYNKLDTTIDFSTDIIWTNELAQDVLGVLLKDYFNEISKTIEDVLSFSELNKTIESDIKNQIEKLLYTPKEENFKFGKPPIKNTDKEILYKVSSSGSITTTDTIKLLFLRNNKPDSTNNYLNNYRHE